VAPGHQDGAVEVDAVTATMIRKDTPNGVDCFLSLCLWDGFEPGECKTKAT
jgi:hypothetical protein